MRGRIIGSFVCLAVSFILSYIFKKFGFFDFGTKTFGDILWGGIIGSLGFFFTMTILVIRRKKGNQGK